MTKYYIHKSKYDNKKLCFMFFTKKVFGILKILNPVPIQKLSGQSKPGRLHLYFIIYFFSVFVTPVRWRSLFVNSLNSLIIWNVLYYSLYVLHFDVKK